MGEDLFAWLSNKNPPQIPIINLDTLVTKASPSIQTPLELADIHNIRFAIDTVDVSILAQKKAWPTSERVSHVSWNGQDAQALLGFWNPSNQRINVLPVAEKAVSKPLLSFSLNIGDEIVHIPLQKVDFEQGFWDLIPIKNTFLSDRKMWLNFHFSGRYVTLVVISPDKISNISLNLGDKSILKGKLLSVNNQAQTFRLHPNFGQWMSIKGSQSQRADIHQFEKKGTLDMLGETKTGTTFRFPILAYNKRFILPDSLATFLKPPKRNTNP